MSSQQQIIVRPFAPHARTRFTERLSESLRSYWTGPLSLKSPELARLWAGPPASSGIYVSEETALTYSAVWNAVSLIAGHVAAVPLKLYKRLPNGGKEPNIAHPLYRLLHDSPNPEMSSVTYRETCQAHVLLWGNSYSEIERNGGGRPIALWPLLPHAVSTYREGATGPLRYRVTNPSGSTVEFEPSDILHLRGLSPDGVTGYSVIGKARESVGLGLATERFGGTFFGNGSTFGGIIKYPVGAAGSQQARDDNKRMLQERHQGIDRAHRLLALYDGGEYQQLGIPPEDAQFLQTRKFQIEEVARWFNLPPHKIKNLDRATFSNIEHQSIEYVTDSLMPWLRRWEAELLGKLISPLDRDQFFEFSIDGLLRGDAAGRAALYKSMFEVGAITPNEIRIRENLNPLPGGDSTYVPTAMTSVGKNA